LKPRFLPCTTADIGRDAHWKYTTPARSESKRIFKLIEGCQFGIHDISRTELDTDSQLPRFNMPLELGMFLGAQRF
jgi:hypothetical protein